MSWESSWRWPADGRRELFVPPRLSTSFTSVGDWVSSFWGEMCSSGSGVVEVVYGRELDKHICDKINFAVESVWMGESWIKCVHQLIRFKGGGSCVWTRTGKNINDKDNVCCCWTCRKGRILSNNDFSPYGKGHFPISHSRGCERTRCVHYWVCNQWKWSMNNLFLGNSSLSKHFIKLVTQTI